MKYSTVATVILGLVLPIFVSAQNVHNPEVKLYYQARPTVCVTHAACLLFNVGCPPCHTSSTTTSTSATPTSSTSKTTTTTTPSSVAPCSAPGMPSDISAQRAAALVNGNEFRRKHGAPPLTVDPTLEADAQQHAEYLASTQTFEETISSTYGETVAGIPCSGTYYPPTLEGANRVWYDNKQFYCPGAGPVENAPTAESFTEMIWKGAQQVGYGAAVGVDGNMYFVARYTPKGNTPGAAAALANLQCTEVP